ncbi:hypothetical protein DAPPUDRAFT_120024 [Daphnia pulex]|uniref:Uncharacterized protein n=1 Tax=Daphnia pulex TaxID=6669 RepID=E9I037_DAPPU|nr:hypothetical protein DAPPUDRAFT_120024 [Daphnia pulex]|eukprot:EFX62643.1 hypothetical protein DAPPUDRAFT_120024 [Daphnia pulex]
MESVGLIHRDADLLQFVDVYLQNPDSACIQARYFTASPRCIIADGTMRSYLKRTKGHTGYRSCNRCIQKEEMINLAILLRSVNTPRRTDVNFLTYHTNSLSGDEHLKDIRDVNPFVKIDFPMVTGFIIDPMHTGIEGAFSRRFEGFILVPEEGKLSSSKIDEADRRIKFFRLCRPFGFDRYEGKFSTCKNCKIHVKRNILYYLLYPLFQGIFDETNLEHIMLLQYGMLLLGAFNKEPVSRTNIIEAQKTFQRYSVDLTELGIPCRFVSHQVTHLWEDVEKYGCGVKAKRVFLSKVF